jgi:hypothetical protein
LPKIRSLKILNFVTSEAVEKNDLGIVGCKLIDGTGNFFQKVSVPTPWLHLQKLRFYKVPLKSRIVEKTLCPTFKR